MKYEILFCDVDGTLLNSRRQLSKENIAAVREWIRAGGKFIISTGRPFAGVTEISTKLGFESPSCILYNGAEVYIDGEKIFSACLKEKVAKKIVEEGRKRNSTMILWRENVLYAEKPCEKVDFYKSISKVEPVYVGDLSKVCDDKVVKILWYDDETLTPIYKNQLQNEVLGASSFISRPDFLEFVDENCSKKTALEKVAEYFCVPLEKTVAIGDGDNDIPMFEAAGLSVAMENASEFVKSKCALTTLSCDEDGVSKLINDILKDRV